jgi:hypothetical protein
VGSRDRIALHGAHAPPCDGRADSAVGAARQIPKTPRPASQQPSSSAEPGVEPPQASQHNAEGRQDVPEGYGFIGIGEAGEQPQHRIGKRHRCA